MQQQATIDPLGRITSYAYEALNRFTNTTYADGTATSSAYDANGDPNSVDQLGRVTTCPDCA